MARKHPAVLAALVVLATCSTLRSAEYRPLQYRPIGAVPIGERFVPSPAPDIQGVWTGRGWGEVKLGPTKDGICEGTYTDTYGDQLGTIRLKWSPSTEQYVGAWREGTLRHGSLAIRLRSDSEKSIRGAWTTDSSCELMPGFPALTDLEWVAANPQAAPDERSEAGFNGSIKELIDQARYEHWGLQRHREQQQNARTATINQLVRIRTR